ncbi:MAG: DUF1540 domain-containing protein [Clostridia bacterium]|nr:DUF1540 domain-containing protein [Clostridia bacterium]
MYDLKCGQKNCKYNHGYCCCARNVSVSSGTACTTYEPADNELNLNTESAAEFSKPDFSVDTAVKCDAPCLFNRAQKCIANGITVSTDDSGCAECLTFIKK